MSQPSPHFFQGIIANLGYWQQQISQFTEADMGYFQKEQANLLLAIELGLALPESQANASELLLSLFTFIERCGFWQKWLPLFEQTTAVTLPKHSVLHCKALNRLGQLYRLLHRLDEARAIHQKAETLAHECGDTQTIAEIYFNLSAGYRQQYDYAQAEFYGDKSLTVFKTLPYAEHGQAAALGMLGLIALDCNNLDEAEIRLRQALDIRLELGESTELARVYNGLAITLHRKKQFAAALYYFQQALNQLNITISERDKVEVYLSLGALHFDLKQYEKAEIIFRQAHVIVKKTYGNIFLQAVLAQSLGNSLLKQERLSEAESQLQHSYMLWQQLGDNLNLANTLGTLGETLAKQADFDNAVDFYNKALLLLAEFPDNAWANKLHAEFLVEKETVSERLIV